MHEQLSILQHSLGLNQYGEGTPFRNHFVTGPGSDNYAHCLALVEQGLMIKRAMPAALTGGADCFSVTEDGRLYVATASPKRPPEPKRTRSQARYQEYLHSEVCESFAEWLGINTRCEFWRGKYRMVDPRWQWDEGWCTTKKAAREAFRALRAKWRAAERSRAEDARAHRAELADARGKELSNG
jgi:hypothetical protein